MIDFKAILDQIGPALTALTAVALADLVTGVAGSVRSHTFDMAKVADFITSHILARVLPIGVLVVLGTQSQALGVLAATATAAYVAETVASVASNLGITTPPAA